MIKTNRLILVPTDTNHLSIYQEILSSNELTKYLPKGEAYTDTEIDEHLNNRIKHWAENGFGSYVIFEKDIPDVAIGYAGVELCPNPNFSDIRYAMSPSMQGKGFVKEAAQAIILETFKIKKHHKIYGVSINENLASVSILQKLGMKREHNVNPYDEHQNLITFSIKAPSDE